MLSHERKLLQTEIKHCRVLGTYVNVHQTSLTSKLWNSLWHEMAGQHIPSITSIPKQLT